MTILLGVAVVVVVDDVLVVVVAGVIVVTEFVLEVLVVSALVAR
jgi:hypothetical protein